MLHSVQAKAASPTTITTKLDNDVLFGTDRGYTGGLQLSMTKANLEMVDFLVSPFEKLFGVSSDLSHTDQIAFNYELYSFYIVDSEHEEPVKNAGIAYLTTTRFYFVDDIQYTFDLGAGWLGPAVKGEEVHNGIHEILGNGEAEGWEHQPPDQPAFRLGLERKANLLETQNRHLAFFYSVSGIIGNIETSAYAHLGMIYHSLHKPIFAFNKLSYIQLQSNGFGWFTYAFGGARYNFYSTFPDGRILTEDEGVDGFRKANTEFNYGIGFSQNGFSLALTGTTWGEMYNNQPDDRFRFASLVASFQF